MNIVEKAQLVATVAHGACNQRRKYDGAPYIVHPERVVKILSSVTSDENILAAAWLHDVVEDTGITINFIRENFNDKVTTYVDGMTDVSTLEDGNRAERKAIDRAHTAQATDEGKTIKLADLIDNTRDICNADKKFAKVYMTEKKLLLEEALVGGNPVLYDIAMQLITDWENHVEIEGVV